MRKPCKMKQKYFGLQKCLDFGSGGEYTKGNFGEDNGVPPPMGEERLFSFSPERKGSLQWVTAKQTLSAR